MFFDFSLSQTYFKLPQFQYKQDLNEQTVKSLCDQLSIKKYHFAAVFLCKMKLNQINCKFFSHLLNPVFFHFFLFNLITQNICCFLCWLAVLICFFNIFITSLQIIISVTIFLRVVLFLKGRAQVTQSPSTDLHNAKIKKSCFVHAS